MTPTYTRSVTLDIQTGIPLWWDEIPYKGKWAFAKKGREAQQQVTNASLANAGTDTARRTDQYNSGNADIGQLEATAPGQLSPAAAAMLASQQRKIQDTYNGARQVGLQRLAQRGMGTLTGETSSLNNSMARGQASDELNANENAQILSHQDLLSALNARTGLQQLYNPNADLGTASTSAFDQSKMGSTLGDVGGGLATLGSIGSSIVGLGGLNNLGSNLMNGK
jgi:hypothetical protein